MGKFSKMNTNNSNLVKRLLSVFEDNTVLLPVPRGEKGCRDKGWQKTTMERMKDPAYLARLEQGNVAVLLGTASDNLISIDFDDEEFLEAFMVENPRLRESTFTRGKRGGNVFLRIEGEMPEFANLKDHEGQPIGELRSGACSTVVSGLHPEGVEYGIVKDGPPIRMAFDEIVWPDFVRFPKQNEESETLDSAADAPLISDGKNIRFNTSGIAEEFAKRNEIRYESEEGRFYLYGNDHGVWNWIKSVGLKESVRLCILQLASELLDEQSNLKCRSMVTPNRVRDVVEFLKGMTEMAFEFDADSNLVHTSTGVIRLTESGLVCPMPHSPDHYIRNAHDFDFLRTPKWVEVVRSLGGLAALSTFKSDPLELLFGQRPKKFLKYIEGMLNPEDIELFQLWLGSALLSENRYQKILVMSGPSGCGKSQLTKIVEALVGPENIASLRANRLSERFETSGYIGKKLLVGSDVADDFLSGKQAELLKSLTGGDSVPFERKGADFGSLKGNFGVLISTNHKLRVPSSDKPGPWRRRLLAIECKPRRYVEEIPNFGEKLLGEEGDGIFTWAVYGAAKLLRQSGFVLSTEQQKRVEDIVVMRDSVNGFLQSKVHNDKGNFTSEEAESAYRAYCVEASHDPLNPREFHIRLRTEMKSTFGIPKCNNVKRNGKCKRGYRGVTLNA